MITLAEAVFALEIAARDVVVTGELAPMKAADRRDVELLSSDAVAVE